MPYKFSYAAKMVVQAAEFAEIENDFAPLRKWVAAMIEAYNDDVPPPFKRVINPATNGTVRYVAKSDMADESLLDALNERYDWTPDQDMPVIDFDSIEEIEF